MDMELDWEMLAQPLLIFNQHSSNQQGTDAELKMSAARVLRQMQIISFLLFSHSSSALRLQQNLRLSSIQPPHIHHMFRHVFKTTMRVCQMGVGQISL
jgi:hypothetical protein